MSILELQNMVKQLLDAEVWTFGEWQDEYKSDLWDEQIEEDAKAGRLDKFIEQALEDIKAGRTKPI